MASMTFSSSKNLTRASPTKSTYLRSFCEVAWCPSSRAFSDSIPTSGLDVMEDPGSLYNFHSISGNYKSHKLLFEAWTVVKITIKIR